MTTVTIYLAGPIDIGKDIPRWKSSLMEYIKMAAKQDVTVVAFDPANAYTSINWVNYDLAKSAYVEDINKQALMHSDIMVVSLPQGVSSVGTPIEIDIAYSADIPIVILTDTLPGVSVYLDNRIPPENWIKIDQHDPDNTDWHANTFNKILEISKIQ